MKERRLITALIFILVLAATYSIALAEPERVNVRPFGGEYCATTSQEVYVQYGWAACSRGLVSDYFDSIGHEFYLNGDHLYSSGEIGNDLWGPIEPFLDWGGEECLWHVDNTWLAWWNYRLGMMKAGDYEIHFIRSFDFTITDGTDSDGDGNIDIREGTQEYFTTLHIVEDECPE